MKKIATKGVIRQRGQITIPDEIRREIEWAAPDSVVSIELADNGDIRICPYQKQNEAAYDWDAMWTRIRASRSIRGKGGSLSGFVIKDRHSRR